MAKIQRQRICIYIDTDFYRLIQKKAEEQGSSASWLIRRAIKGALENGQ